MLQPYFQVSDYIEERDPCTSSLASIYVLVVLQASHVLVVLEASYLYSRFTTQYSRGHDFIIFHFHTLFHVYHVCYLFGRSYKPDDSSNIIFLHPRYSVVQSSSGEFAGQKFLVSSERLDALAKIFEFTILEEIAGEFSSTCTPCCILQNCRMSNDCDKKYLRF